MEKKIRINKFIAQCGTTSRRGADELILAKKVKLNGKIVTEPGVLVDEKDEITVNGEKIEPQKNLYMIFYKPPGYITTKSDEKGRKTIYEFLPEDLKHLKPAGRLDKDSSGLLFLTNDGELIQQMTHPKIKIEKVYRVVVKGKIKPHDIEKLAAGIEIEKDKIAYAETFVLDVSREKSELEVTLYQGYNRQIRRMMEIIGHDVISLKRIRHATLTIQGLGRGDYKFLKPKQLQELRNHIKKCEKASK